jgi:hypothetical protein
MPTRRSSLAWLATAATAIHLAVIPEVSAQSPSAAQAAQRLVAATPAAQRAELLLPFTDAARSDWSYVPRRRDGVAWKAMSATQREAGTALMRTALNEQGLDKVRAVMALEITLRQLETFGLSRDPENYAFALYGQPGTGGWGWRIEGHHLSLHFSLDGDRYVSTLPQFFGANPASVPRDVGGGAPREGFRLLGHEEDLAREWLASLNPGQRSRAVFDTRPFGDIVSRSAARVQPLEAVGLPFADMDGGQQAQVLKLIGVFADHLQPELAQARLARVRAAPLDAIRVGWAGSTQPRQPHYFRIQGAHFLIEFDNSGGNHIHSVWRDFDGDFGRDVLREHYQRAQGSAHGHGMALTRVKPGKE